MPKILHFTFFKFWIPFLKSRAYTFSTSQPPQSVTFLHVAFFHSQTCFKHLFFTAQKSPIPFRRHSDIIPISFRRHTITKTSKKLSPKSILINSTKLFDWLARKVDFECGFYRLNRFLFLRDRLGLHKQPKSYCRYVHQSWYTVDWWNKNELCQIIK